MTGEDSRVGGKPAASPILHHELNTLDKAYAEVHASELTQGCIVSFCAGIRSASKDSKAG